MSLERLRKFLASVPPGKIGERATLLGLLEACWPEFQDSDQEAMAPHKLRRAENLRWDPPMLSFILERHGGTVSGSTRASLQEWTLDIERQTTEVNDTGFRQLYRMDARWKAQPVAEEIAKLILNREQDERLEWKADGTAHVVMIRIIPANYACTFTDRKKRFLAALDKLLGDGWERRRKNVYAPRGTQAQGPQREGGELAGMRTDANRLFDELNQKYWRGRLPKFQVCFWEGFPATLDGQCFNSTRLIFLREGLTGRKLRGTLLHEMCHIGPKVGEDHGPRWQRKIKRLVRLGETELVDQLDAFRDPDVRRYLESLAQERIARWRQKQEGIANKPRK